jgi:hypothetical protein
MGWCHRHFARAAVAALAARQWHPAVAALATRQWHPVLYAAETAAPQMLKSAFLLC